MIFLIYFHLHFEALQQIIGELGNWGTRGYDNMIYVFVGGAAVVGRASKEINHDEMRY